MGAGREGGWGRGGRGVGAGREGGVGAGREGGGGGEGGGVGAGREGGAPFDSRKYAVRFRPIQIVLGGGGGGGGGGLSAFGRFNLWGVRMYVNFYYKGGEGGGDTHDNGM